MNAFGFRLCFHAQKFKFAFTFIFVSILTTPLYHSKANPQDAKSIAIVRVIAQVSIDIDGLGDRVRD